MSFLYCIRAPSGAKKNEWKKCNDFNFRDENAQIKTSVTSQGTHVILKEKKSISSLWEFSWGSVPPPPVQMPLQKGKGANCKYITLTNWTFRKEKGHLSEVNKGIFKWGT